MNSELNREALMHKLDMAMTASCGCNTKTHEHQHHDEACLYRVLCEARAALSTEAQPEVTGAVAWRLRIGDSDLWAYTETEDRADFYGKQSGLKYIKEPLYTALPDAGFAAGMMKAAELAHGLLRNSLLNMSAESVRSTILSAIPAESKAALREVCMKVASIAAEYGKDCGNLPPEQGRLSAIVNSVLEGKS